MALRPSLGERGKGGERELEELPEEREGVVGPRDEGLNAVSKSNLGVLL
jgi:hypothetical protein